MSIIWTPSPQTDATMAYVDAPIVVMVMPYGPSSSVKPSLPSVRADTGAGLYGSVMSIIWTPSPLMAVAMAKVDESIVTVVTACGWNSSV